MRSSSSRTASIITSESRLASLAARKRSSLTARASSVWRLSVMSSAWATRYAIPPSALRVALTWKRALTTVPSGCTKRVSRTKVRNSPDSRERNRTRTRRRCSGWAASMKVATVISSRRPAEQAAHHLVHVDDLAARRADRDPHRRGLEHEPERLGGRVVGGGRTGVPEGRGCGKVDRHRERSADAPLAPPDAPHHAVGGSPAPAPRRSSSRLGRAATLRNDERRQRLCQATRASRGPSGPCRRHRSGGHERSFHGHRRPGAPAGRRSRRAVPRLRGRRVVGASHGRGRRAARRGLAPASASGAGTASRPCSRTGPSRWSPSSRPRSSGRSRCRSTRRTRASSSATCSWTPARGSSSCRRTSPTGSRSSSARRRRTSRPRSWSVTTTPCRRPSRCRRGRTRSAAGAAEPVAVDEAELGPADLACFIYTAGTTGPSKGCMLPHHYVVALGEQIARAWGRTADDVVLTPLPLFHFNAISVCVVGTLLVGRPRRDRPEVLGQPVLARGAAHRRDDALDARLARDPRRQRRGPPGPGRSPAAPVRGGADAARHRPHLARAVRLRDVQRRLRAHRGVADLDAPGRRDEQGGRRGQAERRRVRGPARRRRRRRGRRSARSARSCAGPRGRT